tara:strand:- start:742 stop:1332 length:591 start_codon:yes stop_codon:yes gene_type:complete
MKRITLYFFRGLLTVLPLGLTIYIIYFFIAASEKYVSTLIQPLLGTLYFPGIGLLITIACIIALGILISQPFLYKIFGLLELPFTNIPVVKNVYTSIKSFAEYFSEDNSKKNNQVVIVTIPNSDINLVGLVTRESIDELGPFDNNMVAVYVPMSYMVGGYTIFIPKKLIRPINMSVEEAMKNSLLAWLTKTDKRRS